MGTHVFEKYPENSKFGGKRVLNIGCGFAQFKAPNVVNVDAFGICKPDVVWDLSKTPLPFRDNEFDLILANHILEHVPKWWDCFNDCARILKPGGRLEVFVPGSGGDSTLGYRDHINTINRCSFFGTFGNYRNGSNAWAEENSRSHSNRLKFHQHQTRTYTKWWIKYAPAALRRWMCEHLRNIIVEDGYIFIKVSEKEFREEELRNGKRDGNSALAMLSLRETGL